MNHRVNVGLIGSIIFVDSYKEAFLKFFKHIQINSTSLENVKDETLHFLNCLKESDYLLFEKATSIHFNLLINILKQGKNIFLVENDLSLNELIELEMVANEANLKCVQMRNNDYYQYIQPLTQIVEEAKYLEFEGYYSLIHPYTERQSLENYIQLSVRYLVTFLKGSIKQITPKFYRFIEENDNLLLLFVEYANGKSAILKFLSVQTNKRHCIKIFNQNQLVEYTYSADGLNGNQNSYIDKVIKEFKKTISEIKNPSQSFLDEIQIVEITSTILKKIENFSELK